jgi:hypothetical protein
VPGLEHHTLMRPTLVPLQRARAVVVVVLWLEGCFAGEPASRGVVRFGAVMAAAGGVLMVGSLPDNVHRLDGRCYQFGSSCDRGSLLFWSGAAAFATGALVALVAHERANPATQPALARYLPEIAAQNAAIAARSAANAQRDVAASREPTRPVFYCTVSSTDAIGSCSETLEACERARAVRVAARLQMSACAEQRDLVCFKYRSADGGGHVACGATARVCEAMRGRLAAQAGFWSIEACPQPEPRAEPTAAAPPPLAPATLPTAVPQTGAAP